MNLELITPKLIESALRSIAQAEAPPEILLDLKLLNTGERSSKIQKEVTLAQHLNRLTTTALDQQRYMEELQTVTKKKTRAELLEELERDFQTTNSELKAWSALYHRYLSPVPIDTATLAESANIVEQHYRRYVKQGLKYLTQTLQEAELEARNQYQAAPDRYLPTPKYARLFGVQKHIKDLAYQLSSQDGPRFLSVEGLGGIGKTALAHAIALVRAASGEITTTLWVSAQQESLSGEGNLLKTDKSTRTLEDVVIQLARQLEMHNLAGLSATEKLERIRPTLKQDPYLVVIDNLETFEDTKTLLPALEPLAGTSRFLLTSRHTLQHIPYVYTFTVPELSFDDSYALVNNELQRRGYTDMLPEDLMHQLYQATGGLPLALKLATAQIGRLPAAEILAGLQDTDREKTNNMYTYIYRRSWQMLNNAAKQLLVYGMLLVGPEGENLDFIRGMSGLSGADFESGLGQLLEYSLLETNHSLECPHYYLHRMTITFLQTDILKRW